MLEEMNSLHQNDPCELSDLLKEARISRRSYCTLQGQICSKRLCTTRM